SRSEIGLGDVAEEGGQRLDNHRKPSGGLLDRLGGLGRFGDHVEHEPDHQKRRDELARTGCQLHDVAASRWKCLEPISIWLKTVDECGWAVKLTVARRLSTLDACRREPPLTMWIVMPARSSLPN